MGYRRHHGTSLQRAGQLSLPASDEKFWNALGNNFKFVLVAVPIQYIIAFGIALLLNQQVRGLKFFRVVFLLPLT